MAKRETLLGAERTSLLGMHRRNLSEQQITIASLISNEIECADNMAEHLILAFAKKVEPFVQGQQVEITEFIKDCVQDLVELADDLLHRKQESGRRFVANMDSDAQRFNGFVQWRNPL